MSLSVHLAAVGTGFGIGLSVAAPVGPMGMLCIQRTLASGLGTGLATGFGAATVHLAYSTIAILGFGSTAEPWIESNAIVLRIVSAVTLLWFAIRIHQRPTVCVGPINIERVRLLRAYLGAIALGLTNPLTVIFFLAALQVFTQSASASLVAGVFIGSAVWWTALSTTVASLRSRLPLRMLSLGNRFASLLLLGLGAAMLLRVAQSILQH